MRRELARSVAPKFARPELRAAGRVPAGVMPAGGQHLHLGGMADPGERSALAHERWRSSGLSRCLFDRSLNSPPPVQPRVDAAEPSPIEPEPIVPSTR